MEARKCPKHKIPMVKVTMIFCPACRGEAKTKRKIESAKENLPKSRDGRPKGRPKGIKEGKPRKRRKQKTKTRRAGVRAPTQR